MFTLLLGSSSLFAVDITLPSADIEAAGGLREALNTINAAPGTTNTITIPFSALTGQTNNLPPIEITNSNNLTINGISGGTTLNGGDTYRGLFVSRAIDTRRDSTARRAARGTEKRKREF